MKRRIFCAVMTVVLVLTMLPVIVAAEGAVEIAFTQRETKAGATQVQVGVDMSNNPGLVTATIPVTWDNDVLHLVDVIPSEDILSAGWIGMSMDEYESNGTYYLAWDNDLAEADFTTEVGCLAELVFDIVDPSKDTNTTLAFDMDDPIANVMNFDMEDLRETVTVNAANGTVAVAAEAGGDDPVVDPESAQFYMPTVDRVRMGEPFSLPVDLVNNAGLSSIIIDVYYDADVFNYVDAVYGSEFLKPITNAMTDAEGNPFLRCTWVDGLENIVGDKTFVTLNFLVNEGVEEGSYEFDIVYDPDNVYMVEGYDYYNVDMAVVKGVANIVDYIPGDIDGDGNVNAKDQGRLLQYLAGLPVTVDVKALDVNGDGNVNAKDQGRLLQYLAGLPVEIY
ncbi:MAG: hypothetical protein IJB52_14560 [Clostridia bacterium]|nr:hypothetical protein [Clostridia bacterium]